MNVEPVLRVLDALGATYALIGAHAMAARGYPRFTVDIALLTTDSRVLDRATWTTIERDSAAVDARRGDADDPLGGVVHILLSDGTDIDVVLGRWKWEAAVIERSELLQIAPGLTLPVPLLSDLILLKLAAGGFLDLHDAAAMLETGERATLETEVESRIADVRPDIRAEWRDLLARLG
jgi:hypothetical protein